MISHVYIGVNNFERAFRLYAAVMDALGLALKFRDDERPWAGWVARDKPRPLFLIGRPYDGALAVAGNGQMVALQADTREAVDRAYAAALANGASCEGAPGLRAHYHPDYYGAYFRDGDGNKVGVCCHGAVN